MRKLLILIIFSILMFPLASKAGIYGTLKGKVVDNEGKPVIGATVKIIGTSRGTYVKDKDGKFTITNVHPGDYDVSVTAVGLAKYQVSVRINADETTEISVTLTDLSIKTQTIIVTAEKMVNNTTIGTDRKVNSEQIQTVAREGLQGVVSLTPGVYSDGTGFYIRGSRPEETQVRVDGMEVGNQFTGGYGVGGILDFPMASNYATDQVDVKTGGFSAEYGGTIGGIVNSVLKTGRTDRFEGFLRYRTDVDALWGSQKNGLQVTQEQDRMGYTLSGPGAKYQGPQQNRIEYGFGGPLPVLNQSTFYLTGVYMHENYRNNGYQIYDPVDLNHLNLPQNNLGNLPDNEEYLKNITGRVVLGISNDIKLTLGGSFGMTNIEAANSGWLYARDYGVINGISNNITEGVAKNTVANSLILNFFAKINHQLNNRSYYEFTVSNTLNNDQESRRKTFGTPGFFTGYDIWYPQDNYKVVGSSLVAGSDKIIDQYSPVQFLPSTKDGYIKSFSERGINPLTGYIEGASDATGSDNPYGLPNFYPNHGNGSGFSFRESKYWEFTGDYNLAIEGEFTHMFKAGFLFRLFQLRLHNNQLPWDSNPFYDVYTDQWGGNIYAKDLPSTYDKTSVPYKPYEGAFYVQDQISYKGIIISPGLRLDFYNPNSNYRTNPNEFVSIASDTGFTAASLKAQVSPRLNVTYPITERSNVTIGYSINFERPTLEYMYDGFNKYMLRGNDIIGNPNMPAQRTNAFETVYNNQISDNFALDVTAYYKDIYNQLGIQYVPSVPIPYYQYTVAEFGSVKGLEIDFRKTPTLNDHIGFDVNYTISSANGSSSSASGNYGLALDPYTDKPAYALNEFPVNWDRTHVINSNIYFVWGNQQGPSIGGIQPLENCQASFATVFRTGTPYTVVDLKNHPVGEINSAREPAWWRTDFRLVKSFRLKDWFGESMGNSFLDLSVDIVNLFNNRQVIGVNSITGDPNDNGTSFLVVEGNFSSTPYYKDANYGLPETFASSQYDNFGNRLYNVNADFDHNGIVTQHEKYLAYQKYLQVALSGQYNNQLPIQVWFSVMVRF